MSSTMKSFLWLLIGFPLLFLFFAWVEKNWLLFYFSIPIALVISLIAYFVSKKHENDEERY